MKDRHPNRLITEKSPYLLQHAYNPVQWFPWGPEAFLKAQQDNKPVFLSIGYSTCHWCHVMEHESFEDDDIAKLLNDHFISIKVDREERPDIDSIYMSFVTATTGSGGWPLSAFLTPEQKPFYGGTYFPPQARWGSPGFKDLLWSIHHKWTNQEQTIRASGESLLASFHQQLQDKTSSPHIFSAGILDQAYQQLEHNFDTQNGGFGHSPKFPMGHNLSFLMRYWKNTNEPQALKMVEKTLMTMAQSGICDQLGGGFHRYATDTHWQVPHFEKMLYDQALLVKIYTEAFLATGHDIYADTVRQTLDYVLRDMTDPGGGFYCAEDADSLSAYSVEKKEGAYYIWNTKELMEFLSPEELKILSQHYGIESQGNAVFDPHGEFAGENILHVKRPVEDKDILAQIKRKMLERRITRPRPHRDDKILLDWNALMISACVLAGRVLHDERYVAAGQQAAAFIVTHLKREDGRLLHRYRDKEAGILAGLDDYAFWTAALLDLYENTFEEHYFQEACHIADVMIELFWDHKQGAFFLTAKDSEALIYRPKEVYDGAVPSGNSIAALSLIRLYHLTGEQKYRNTVEDIFRFFYDVISTYSAGYCQMLMAVQFYIGPVREVTMAGDYHSGVGRDLLQYLLKVWDPQRVLSVRPYGLDPDGLDQQPFVQICSNRVCHQPVKTLDELQKVLA